LILSLASALFRHADFVSPSGGSSARNCSLVNLGWAPGLRRSLDGSKDGARVSTGNSHFTTTGALGGHVLHVASKTKQSSASCRVRVRMESGSRANTPEPEMRSCCSLPLALPLAKW